MNDLTACLDDGLSLNPFSWVNGPVIGQSLLASVLHAQSRSIPASVILYRLAQVGCAGRARGAMDINQKRRQGRL